MGYDWRAIVEIDGKHYLDAGLELGQEENGDFIFVTGVGETRANVDRYTGVEQDKHYLVEQREFEGNKVVRRVVAESETAFLDTSGMHSVYYIQMRGTKGMMKQTWRLVSMTGEELMKQPVIHWDSKENTILNPPYEYIPHYEDLNEY
ncbi:hypothetical protein [Bacillus toyonensis]|uniref:hypothetical protein n=1 Tax=Bacillus toyonensis TaxID=155322 RepID=UPI000BF678C0|nr:hypothetical protein [Bacillus toyonensis]PGF04981.1 hypothetical protein COM61_00645 [Bacillus toyonensis]